MATAADSRENKLLQDGVDARRQRDDEKALGLFRQAYALHASPRAAAQMGLAEIALGRWPQSEAHLEEATAARNDPWIEKNRKSLVEALARVHRQVGRLEVLGAPVGAEVVIAGEAHGPLPLADPIRVRAGDVRFEIRAKGYESETRTVNVEPGQLTRETVVLSVVAKATPPGTRTAALVAPPPMALAARPAADAPGALTGIAARSGETSLSRAPASSGAGLRTTGVVLAALGVAGIAAGTLFSWKVRSASETDSAAPQYVPGSESNGQRYQTAQWIGYGAGAALLVGGVITYLVGATR